MQKQNLLLHILSSLLFGVIGFGESGRLSVVSSSIFLILILLWNPSPLGHHYRSSRKSGLLLLMGFTILAMCISIILSKFDNSLLLGVVSQNEIRLIGVIILAIAVFSIKSIYLFIVVIYSLSFGIICNSSYSLLKTLTLEPQLLITRQALGVFNETAHVVGVTTASSLAALCVVSLSLFLFPRIRAYQPFFLAASIASIVTLLLISITTVTRTGIIASVICIPLLLLMITISFDSILFISQRGKLRISRSSLQLIIVFISVVWFTFGLIAALPNTDILKYQLSYGWNDRILDSGNESNEYRLDYFNLGVQRFLVDGNFELFSSNSIGSSPQTMTFYYHNFIFDMIKMGGLVGFVLSIALLVYFLLPFFKLVLPKHRSKLVFLNSSAFFWVLSIPGFFTVFAFLNGTVLEGFGPAWSYAILIILVTYFCQWVFDCSLSRPTARRLTLHIK